MEISAIEYGAFAYAMVKYQYLSHAMQIVSYDWTPLDSHRGMLSVRKKCRFQSELARILMNVIVDTSYSGKLLGDLLVDYPLATTRTAVDLVAIGTLRRWPGVDIILSHASGVLRFLGFRAVLGLESPTMAGRLGALDAGCVREDFGRFYYDLALSTSASQLNRLLDWTSSEKVLFGSDCPYVPLPGIRGIVSQYEQFVG
ncbi:hypothetical protein NEMBOFW57_004601 [Staphylotrichum longicolle]|uniref:Amidohydrolase-related domain-containing protein n=1 Tax=Staphylotrichum longicolle TaxID=669026 RepID=A0AAD4I496_9PEZI|nr:hypothetical protein NEMBOFW57_004601 [Staphylotrichum longicolle]